MSEQLVIRLGSRAEHNISWLVWASHSQEVIASGEIAGADQLPELAVRLGGRPVVALVPASDVVLKQVSLPAKPVLASAACYPMLCYCQSNSYRHVFSYTNNGC